MIANLASRRFARSRLIGVIVLIGLGAAACGTASTNSSTSTPHAAVISSGLSGLSCVDAQHCFAVGSYLPYDKDAANGDPDGDGEAQHTLVARSGATSSAWQKLTSPDKGLGGALLFSVSCVTANNCTAVGYYQEKLQKTSDKTSPPRFPLIENFNGTSWTIAETPGVPTNATLYGVSCPSASNCLAVGATSLPANPRTGVAAESLFIEHYDGTGWAVQPIVTPSNESDAFGAVSCPNATTCFAVGNTSPIANPSAVEPLVERLTGGVWSAVTLPVVGSGHGVLYSVSCVSPLNCLAVGTAPTKNWPSSALVMSMTGSTWSVNPTALGAAGVNSLTTVSCSSPSSCVAAGTTSADAVAAPKPLVTAITGTTWQPLQIVGAVGFVRALSCTSATQCVVVGDNQSNSVVATIAGTTWNAVSLPIA